LQRGWRNQPFHAPAATIVHLERRVGKLLNHLKRFTAGLTFVFVQGHAAKPTKLAFILANCREPEPPGAPVS
jgi:hypothetical protein